jgi:hypothetical protein
MHALIACLLLCEDYVCVGFTWKAKARGERQGGGTGKANSVWSGAGHAHALQMLALLVRQNLLSQQDAVGW